MKNSLKINENDYVKNKRLKIRPHLKKSSKSSRKDLLDNNGQDKSNKKNGWINTLLNRSGNALLRKIKINIRLIVFFIALSIIPLIIVGLITYSLTNAAMKENISFYSEQIVEQLESRTSDISLSIMSTAQKFESSIELEEYKKSKLLQDTNLMSEINVSSYFEAIIQSSSNRLQYIGFYDINSSNIIGNYIISSDDLKASDFYKEFMENTEKKDVWILPSDIDQKIAETYKEPIYIYKINPSTINTDSTMGIMIIVPKKQLFNDIFSKTTPVNGGYYCILDEQNRIVASLDDTHLGKNIDDLLNISVDLVKREKNKDGTVADILWKNESNTNFMVTYGILEDTNWKVITAVPFNQMMTKIYEILKTIIILVLICLVISVVVSMIVTRSVTSPIRKISQLLHKLKEGDFREQLDVQYKDELTLLAIDFNNMLTQICGVLKDVINSSQKVADTSENINIHSTRAVSAAEQIANAIAEVAKGASDQALDLNSSTDMINELALRLGEVIKNTSLVQEASIGANELSQKAINTVNDLTEKASDTGKATESIVHEIDELNNELNQITETVNIIFGIADQTNLLALNAAIEAARAGESGKGFAVVADEVKKLAEQSKAASHSISNTINSILNKSSNVVKAANSASITINQQLLAVEETSQAFKSIAESTKGIVSQIINVNVLVESISELKDRTVSSMSNIASIAETSAAASEEISATTEEQIASAILLLEISEELSNLANNLQVNISRFKV